VLVSHHHTIPSVADAVDFVRIVHGHGHDGQPQRAKSWYGFGEPVLAPADGTVVSVSDVHPDEPIGQTGVTPPYGNHIVLAISPRRYAVMAHLQQGSARVAAGELVRLGQPAAAVGDSGNSLWPHLHFHVQDGPKLDDSARTVPMTFRDVVLVRNGRESTPAAADLRRGDRTRRLDG
jgi:murein DD-endopeptidase MepM/ murein hydrolase activator NlpD